MPCKSLSLKRSFVCLFGSFSLGILVFGHAAGAATSVTCLIEPHEVVALSPPVAGILEAIPVDRGDVVQAGQTLARLDTALDDLRVKMAQERAATPYTVAANEARYKFLSSRAERLRDLSTRSIVSQTEFEEAESEAEAARQDLEAARFEKQFAEIEAQEAATIRDQKILKSPSDGIILERRASVGEYQDGTEPILMLTRLDPLRVEAFVPIALYPSLSVGDAVVVEPEAPIGGKYDAKIAVIDRVFDAGTGTVGVRVDLPNPDLALPAGLRCTLHFKDRS